jgi:hypothetical protein
MSTESEEAVEGQLVVPAAAQSEPATVSASQTPKLMRIASMTRAMLEEIRQAPLDEGGRRRLAEIHRYSIAELHDMLSEELRDELDDLFSPLEDSAVSEAELRVAQAQLVGWLEGLFAGIQASVWSQHAAAADQLQQMRLRAIEAQTRQSGERPGQYL